MKKAKTFIWTAAMMLLMMPFHAYGQTTKVGDINGDGNVTVSDVLALVQIILNEEENEPTKEAGEAIDLGLPSGIKWASCNVGAASPEEYGGYYAWGETVEKEVYSWSTYIHCDGSSSTCHDLGSNISGTQYDVAHIKWGGNWRMPTYDEFSELIDNCNTEWTTLNSVIGRKFTSKINGNSIFLPASGENQGSWVGSAGLYGFYWSSTQDASNIVRAYRLLFGSGNVNKDSYYSYISRCLGNTVRPVTGSSNQSGIDKAICDINGDGNVTVSDVLALVQIILNDEEQEEPSVITGEAIDLGLPSGIKWASCNVGATKPEEYGGYYAWGETEEKETYNYKTYKYCQGTSATCTYIGHNISGTKYDVATVKWGSSWRMPTQSEVNELLTKCTVTVSTINGVKGRKLTGPNGNSIFLPHCGYINGTRHALSDYCTLWSASLYDKYRYMAEILTTGPTGSYLQECDRCVGCPIRPVTK